MQIFNTGFFWFVEGILFVIVILALGAWANALAASNESQLLHLGATPLYPWKPDTRVQKTQSGRR